MKLKIGRRDHHHVTFHMDHGNILAEGDASLSMEQIIENVLSWCRNTGINISVTVHRFSRIRAGYGVSQLMKIVTSGMPLMMNLKPCHPTNSRHGSTTSWQHIPS